MIDWVFVSFNSCGYSGTVYVRVRDISMITGGVNGVSTIVLNNGDSVSVESDISEVLKRIMNAMENV